MRTLTTEELSIISGNGAEAPPYGGYDDGPSKGGDKGSKKS